MILDYSKDFRTNLEEYQGLLDNMYFEKTTSRVSGIPNDDDIKSLFYYDDTDSDSEIESQSSCTESSGISSSSESCITSESKFKCGTQNLEKEISFKSPNKVFLSDILSQDSLFHMGERVVEDIHKLSRVWNNWTENEDCQFLKDQLKEHLLDFSNRSRRFIESCVGNLLEDYSGKQKELKNKYRIGVATLLEKAYSEALCVDNFALAKAYNYIKQWWDIANEITHGNCRRKENRRIIKLDRIKSVLQKLEESITMIVHSVKID